MATSALKVVFGLVCLLAVFDESTCRLRFRGIQSNLPIRDGVPATNNPPCKCRELQSTATRAAKRAAIAAERSSKSQQSSANLLKTLARSEKATAYSVPWTILSANDKTSDSSYEVKTAMISAKMDAYNSVVARDTAVLAAKKAFKVCLREMREDEFGLVAPQGSLTLSQGQLPSPRSLVGRI